MTKTELRIKYKKLRSALAKDKIELLSLAIANQLITLPIWDKTYYHIFFPIEKQKEVNTEFILHILQGKDKNCIISKSNFKDVIMTNYLLQDNTKIKVNDYGIPEPVDGIKIPTKKIEVVFVPLLAFDKKGNRIGYGKGFYDKFLEKCNSNCLKIGLSFFSAEEVFTEILSSDIALNYCVTPNAIYKFK